MILIKMVKQASFKELYDVNTISCECVNSFNKKVYFEGLLSTLEGHPTILAPNKDYIIAWSTDLKRLIEFYEMNKLGEKGYITPTVHKPSESQDILHERVLSKSLIRIEKVSLIASINNSNNKEDYSNYIHRALGGMNGILTPEENIFAWSWDKNAELLRKFRKQNNLEEYLPVIFSKPGQDMIV